MKIKFILYASCLLISTSLGVLPIQQILGQEASPASPEPNTVPGSPTEPSSTPTASPSPTPTAVPAPTTTPNTIPTSTEFSQLPCDKDQQLSSPPPATGKPTWETNVYKYYGQISPKTKEANGKGLMIFKQNQFQYYGDFKNNKRSGCGRLSYPVESNINYYLGQFKNDQPQGLGYLKLRNGNEYRGNFAKNKCQGKGVYIFTDKTEKDGLWREDKLEGSDNLSCKEFNRNYR
ncbi:hypothetical protein [Nostoc sp. 'Lobaria pulmonaria (5183) cyanobiont']|uniref:hypothetical protein n=1 Tax=Nostoc sp. 'Lobaria pulmonaria (5183) cyanobiont' TaxID=1618022 RepID=UPI000CF3520C|nr:hypothetical protein [Nostoc sp. 'Lobaria pulmonaria (5183) cyanobiont']